MRPLIIEQVLICWIQTRIRASLWSEHAGRYGESIKASVRLRQCREGTRYHRVQFVMAQRGGSPLQGRREVRAGAAVWLYYSRRKQIPDSLVITKRNISPKH